MLPYDICLFVAPSKSSFTLAAFGPPIAIYITETFHSRIHHIYIRSSSSVITTKLTTQSWTTTSLAFFHSGGKDFNGMGQGRKPRRKRAFMDYGTRKGNATTCQQKPLGFSVWETERKRCHTSRVAQQVSHDRHHADGYLLLAATECQV